MSRPRPVIIPSTAGISTKLWRLADMTIVKKKSEHTALAPGCSLTRSPIVSLHCDSPSFSERLCNRNSHTVLT